MKNTNCFECGQPAVHNHHVIPQVHGGTKTVPLCTGCHGLVHNKDFTKMRELQLAGIRKALAAGKTWGGRKVGTRITVTEEKEAAVKEMYEAKKSISEIHRVTGLTRQSCYRILGLWNRKEKTVAE